MNGLLQINPLDSARFKTFFNGWKKKFKSIASPAAKFIALYYDELCKMTLAPCLNEISEVGNLWFKAIVTLGYIAFLRCDEILNITMGNIALRQDMDGYMFYAITITSRKTELLEPKTFYIYENKLEPGMNAFYSLHKAINHYFLTK